LSFGSLAVSVMTTIVNRYRAVDSLGSVAQRAVGIEVNNSAIPKYRLNTQLGYGFSDFQFTWTVRYLSAVKEFCSNAVKVGVPGCETFADTHTLDAVVYNDAQLAYDNAFRVKGLRVEAGVNNLFGVNPPICYTCTLNGYDAGTYDFPGAFWNVRAKYKF
jgi:iron complex outermembrane recepter protein